MAYVVARNGGRFEIRESFHTARGPRSRTLAGFRVLTSDLLESASRRAQRPFDADAVIRSARKAGARTQIATSGADRTRERFLRASRRMATTTSRPAPAGGRADPGMALLELLGFADAIAAGQSPRPREPLAYPPLARLAAAPSGAATSEP